MFVLQKKEWLCLTCQTQRLMSGGGLDDPPLPAPHPSPKHQAMGSPRHQAPASQQSPLCKPSSQQGQKPAQSQAQKLPTGTDGSGTSVPAAAKQQADTKTGMPPTATGPASTVETQRQPKPTEEKLRTEPEIQTAKESKPTQKKGEQIIPIKDLKKSRHYDVSPIPFCGPGAAFCSVSHQAWSRRFGQTLHAFVKRQHFQIYPSNPHQCVYIFKSTLWSHMLNSMRSSYLHL